MGFCSFLQVFQLKLDGVAFRLIPESSEIQNALRVRELAGIKLIIYIYTCAFGI